MDLATSYLGLKLKNPLVAASSPFSREIANVKQLEDVGVAAVVMYSLFEEQIVHQAAEHEHYQELGTNAYAEALSFVPALDYGPRGPHEYVSHVAEAKKAVDIPIIASLNGTTLGGWIEYATLLQQAGIDALELNIYHIATDASMGAGAVEQRYVEIVEAVKKAVSIPVAVKLGAQFTSPAHFAKKLETVGADGLVLFNRFYQPDIDLETLEIMPGLTLSAPHEMRLALRWIAILDSVVNTSLAATTGIYKAADVLKLLMAGADATMLCAVLLRDGPGAVSDILVGMNDWMEEHEYQSVQQMQGSMNHSACANPSAFERANYMQALTSYACPS